MISTMSDTDLLFKALADPGRRKLMDRLHANDGQTLGELGRHLEMTRQGVTQHLAVLEAANLVAVQWRGREKLHFLNPVPLQEITTARSASSKGRASRPCATSSAAWRTRTSARAAAVQHAHHPRAPGREPASRGSATSRATSRRSISGSDVSRKRKRAS